MIVSAKSAPQTNLNIKAPFTNHRRWVHQTQAQFIGGRQPELDASAGINPR